MARPGLPPFKVDGTFSDYPTATVINGSVMTSGHVIFENDDWIVLKPKGTVQYEVPKMAGTRIIR